MYIWLKMIPSLEIIAIKYIRILVRTTTFFLAGALIFFNLSVFSQNINVNPLFVERGNILNLTISGVGVTFVQNSSTSSCPDSINVNTLNVVLLKGGNVIYPNLINLPNSSVIKATFTISVSEIAGKYDVITGYGGLCPVICSGCFTIYDCSSPPNCNPSISVNPDSSSLGNTLLLTISGVNVTFSQNSSTTCPNLINTDTTNIVLQKGVTILKPVLINLANSTTIDATFTISGTEPIGNYDVITGYGGSCPVVCTSCFTFIDCSSPPIANAGNDVSLCSGENAAIGSGFISGYSYMWIPSTGLNSTTSSAPIANPNTTTQYILTVTDVATGCKDKDTVFVIVNTEIASFTLPDTAYTEKNISISNTSTGGTQWQWTFGDGQSSNEQNPTHIYTIPGKYIVCLNVDGCNSYCDSIFIKLLTSLDRLLRRQGYAIYPNPATQTKLNVIYQNHDKETVVLTLNDLTGKTFHRDVKSNISGRYENQIDLTDVPRGIYFVKIQTGRNVIVEKVVIQ